jgi:hypothetical protein
MGSPSTVSRPEEGSMRRSPGRRSSLTPCPDARRKGRSAEPTKPVPPVTKILMCPSRGGERRNVTLSGELVP